MPFEFKFPDVGEGITEGEVVKWLVKEGAVVKEDQNIAQIETDKAVVDIPSPKAGTILKINFQEGDTIKVGEVLCVIGEAGEKISSPSKPSTKKSKPVKEKGGSVVGELEEGDFEIPTSQALAGEKQSQKVQASPAVRKLAAQKKVDLSTVKGSGDKGQILRRDIASSSDIKKEPVPQQKVQVKRKYDQFGYLERIPLKGIRKKIAENMMKSLDGSAQLTAMEDIDITKLWDLRNKEKIKLKKQGIKLTFLPYIIKATIAALRETPILNSHLEADEILVKKYFNMGIAVETEVGLMVPVIKKAEDKNIIQIAKEIVTLAEKARTRKIDLMDLQGSTFTITNYGSVGGTYATPVLNPGESGILGLGRIFDRVILDKNNKPTNIKVLPVSLTFDHRVLDGAEASRFLESLRSFLEDPTHLLLDMK